MKNYKFEIALLAAFAVTIIFSQFTAFAKDCDVIRNNTLRLHILANSNSEYDQKVKLMVRDKVLEEYGEQFALFDNEENAEAFAENNINEIIKTINDYLSEVKYDKKATAYVTKMYFETREYEGFKMPAGYYNAVRILIGDAKGKNWWCVMYPPMCVPTALEHKNLTAEEIMNLNTGIKLEPKFATVELFEKIKSQLQNSDYPLYKKIMEKLNIKQ